ncbi:hypothetical protein ORIO_12585 [Cereibacter azotoformans]|uniref:hypothetical protein n=1 Tax=Cereibacter azotoformans TaxID=43057 RepID=UPI001EE9C026|nr:hypothetical protein [Cereibacter azotoformans]ULB10740.1 hypothetical protein ORIO_12585 [Cereibacter azotoformans]
MKMIAPITVTDAVMASSNVPEADYPTWASGTTYALGARVILTSTHSIYESVQAGNVGKNPATDTSSTWWIRVGSTNRWRAFDARTGQKVSQSGTIDYSLTLPSICTAVALVGLSAGSVRVRVSDAGGTLIYDQTRQLVDRTDIVSFFTYFTYAPVYSERVVFEDLPGYVGYTLRITISAGVGTAEVGEIVAGKAFEFGTTLVDTEISFEDMSVRDRDAFNNVFIVERDAYDVITFRFAIAVGGEDRMRRAIRDHRAKPAFFYADAALVQRGLAVYGLAKPLRIPLQSAGVSIATLETEELS